MWRSFNSTALAALFLPLLISSLASAEGIEFSRHIRPILADACFRCHGVDASKRRADLRLDEEASWLAERDGVRAIVPGKPDESELLTRIHHQDPDEQMPPAHEVRQLTDGEKALIRQWIEEGAKWQPHWSFVPPERPDTPKVQDEKWAIHDLDRFVLARLESEDLKPAPALDQAGLLRRATLDLTGLPPTIDELDAFLADKSSDAYEKAIDRLLASPRYGEHMATTWLDLARYADTDGYQDDEPRTMWRWREWVIDVLNDNLPYDQFTIQQLAGDLLPDATPEQQLATGFLRNNRVNGEGGIIAEEFRVEYIIDRIETVSSVWMGLTTGCARCHDHKYDPITQTEFYELFAFFNQSPEPGNYRRTAPPTLKVPTRGNAQRLQEVRRELATTNGESPNQKKLKEEEKRILEGAPSTMIMADSKKRDTFILNRGQYDQRGDKVGAGVPKMLPPLPAEATKDRLALARWLVDPKHPLTARVTVNRIWHHHFGRGLVASAEDFGLQGSWPSHPDLLDWLATELVRKKWDLKAFHRMIVTSATYRQSSHVSTEIRKRDPHNALLTRGPGARLPAEVIRDQALFVSGLLVERLGGPSVKPYQPAKLWDEIAGPTTSAYAKGYIQDKGEALYRRSLYTFWRRAIPPPGLEILDAPSREVCSVQRERTNTPLQALALMNDVTYVEAARSFAERMLTKGGTDAASRAAYGFRVVTSRLPNAVELKILTNGLARHLKTFHASPEEAKALITVGESKPNPDLNVSELAAYTALANTLLNLDETINKP